MHQVINYESAMNNSTRDLREYIRKRTCLILIVTVAFCTTMSGFFLGKFISDHQHIRHLVDIGDTAGHRDSSVELSSADFRSLKQLRSYQQAKQMLLTAARHRSQRLQEDNKSNYLPNSLNTEIFNKYISCTQDIPPNTSIESSQFIEQLINNTMARQRDCMRIIQLIVNNSANP